MNKEKLIENIGSQLVVADLLRRHQASRIEMGH